MRRNPLRPWSLLAALGVLCSPVPASAQRTERLAPGDLLAFSRSGRFVVFSSSSADLVPGDTNGLADLFVLDRASGELDRINVDPAGNSSFVNRSPLPSRPPFAASISEDGRVVAFSDFADDLVPGDTNQLRDIFVRDRQVGVTERLSVDPQGRQLLDPSSDSRGFSMPSITSDGRFVAFATLIDGVVSEDMDSSSTVFIRDLQQDTTEAITLGPGVTGEESDFASRPQISADGSIVTFNLINGQFIFAFDRASRTRRFLAQQVTGTSRSEALAISISDDDRFLPYVSTGDPQFFGNGSVLVADLQSDVLERVDVDIDGNPRGTPDDGSIPTISGDGRFVAFTSAANQLVVADEDFTQDLFVRDRVLGVTERIARGVAVDLGGGRVEAPDFPVIDAFVFSNPLISGDGSAVAFSIGGEVFVHERFPVPATLVLAPELAQVVVSGEHCVVASVADAAGIPLPQVAVTFATRDAPVQRISTGVDGRARACFAAPDLPGEQDVAASVAAGANPTAAATVTVVPPPGSPGCRVNAAAVLRSAGGSLATARIGARALRQRVLGDQQFRERGATRIASQGIDVLRCSTRSAMLFGRVRTTASGSPVQYRIDVVDGGPGGSRDRYRIRLTSGFDSGERPLDSGFIDVNPR
jgi:Tol biopolymer transport system component